MKCGFWNKDKAETWVIHIDMAPIFVTDLAIRRRGAMLDET